TILATHIGGRLENEEFWETVVRLFVDSPELRLTDVAPIVHFLQREKFETRRQANLQVEGRTLAAIRTLVGRPPRDAVPPRTHFPLSWEHAPLVDLCLVEDGCAWSIHELCTSAELSAEGTAMHHCVGGYARACATGHSSIWSMQLETVTGPERALTIEVDVPNRRVRQAKGKRNAAPTAREKKVLVRWAGRLGLLVPETLR